MDAEQEIRFETLARLRSLLDNINNANVTLIGDVMLDRYYHGFANNLNSTAPVPVIKIINSDESPGASAHIALGLNSLGMSLDIFSCVGDDSEGLTIKTELESAGVKVSNIITVPNRKTLTKIRFFGSRESLLKNSQILLQADREPLSPLPDGVSDDLVSMACINLKESAALVISDYDKGVVSTKGALELIRIANENKIPVIVDPKLTGLEKSRNATIVLFEIRGLELLQRRLVLDNNNDTAQNLIKNYDWNSLLVLGGIEGMTLYRLDKEPIFFPCNATLTEQQIGLHDAAAAALAVSLGNGFSLLDSVTLASAACDCILSATASKEFISKNSLSLWLEELSWLMQISER
jgi:D-beta-D-heptose 7-phosphate kinase/D-beta-D-heptose 1-phosphate adenosyltransferase